MESAFKDRPFQDVLAGARVPCGEFERFGKNCCIMLPLVARDTVFSKTERPGRHLLLDVREGDIEGCNNGWNSAIMSLKKLGDIIDTFKDFQTRKIVA